MSARSGEELVQPLVLVATSAGVLHIHGEWPVWVRFGVDAAMSCPEPTHPELDEGDWVGFAWDRRRGVIEARVHQSEAGVACRVSYEVVDVADRYLLCRRATGIA